MHIFLAFMVALSTTAVLIPPLARWAPALGLTDRPGPRKIHRTPVPRVGGLAMACGIVLPTLFTVQNTPAVRALLLGIVVLLVFGLWDDRANLGYRVKFAGQVLAVGILMVLGGVRIGTLSLFGVDLPPGILTTALTFFFLIGITNAVNLSDGLDGLAGGMVLLSLSAIAVFSVVTGNIPVATLCLIESGAVLGFLRFNTHPARIFMGDSGSQILGFSVGALALLATQSESSALSAALPLLLVGLPIMDTLTVMWTRVRAGRSPFSADSNHLHHRLLGLGFHHREAVVLMYLLQVILVLLAYRVRFESDAVVIATFLLFVGAVLGTLRFALRSGWTMHDLEPLLSLRRSIAAVLPSSRIASAALLVMAGCLIAYAALVVAANARVGLDVGVLSLVMLIMLVLLISWQRGRPLQWFERAATYVSVVQLVYLDQSAPERSPFVGTLTWTLIAAIGAAALVRFLLSRARRFEVTALDLLVVFICLVMPNLPGISALPADLPGGVAKAVILLYAVEILHSLELKRTMPRVFLGVMLAAIAGRALVAAI